MTSNHRNIVVGNWKMNGSLEQASTLVGQMVAGTSNIHSTDIVVCPPNIYLQHVSQLLDSTKNVKLGAQNLSEHANGAYTGEVSSSMLREVGCEYVICGHSERRQYQRETDQIVANKVMSATNSGLIPIACVGESLEDRQTNNTRFVVERQLDAILNRCESNVLDQLLIAYEPIWAIGTGKAATPDQIQEVHEMIRNRVGTFSSSVAEGCRILYGGSVTDDNAESVLAQDDVDGCLVGGASLNSAQFLAICNVAT